MPTILLVRHAQASFGAVDYDQLSSLGRKQCAVLGEDLARRNLKIERVVSGSLTRHRRSAEIVTAGFQRQIDLDPRWNEYDTDDILARHSRTSARPSRPDGSDQEVVSSREFQALLEPALLAWIQAGNDDVTSEPWPAFLGRARAALEDVAAGLKSSETALVFTSGGPIAAACVSLLAIEEVAFVRLNRVLANTGMTKVVRGGRGTTLISFNDHSHLEREPSELVTYR